MNAKTSKKRKGNRAVLWCCLGAVVVLLGLTVYLALTSRGAVSDAEPDTGTESAPVVTVSIDTAAEEIPLVTGTKQTLVICDMGSYAGLYMEDGSDEIVSGVMMIIVENVSASDLQYAEISLSYEDGTTTAFSVSTLPAGEKAVLLEKNRLSYPGDGVKPTSALVSNVVLFDTPMTLCDSVLEIIGLDGALNVRNVSDEDLDGDIYICYKNAASDLYYGGITYRVKIEGGLSAGELRQVMTGHYTVSGSKIVMVECR